MHVKVVKAASLPEVLGGLGVTKREMPSVIASVTSSKQIDAKAKLPVGFEFEIPDGAISASQVADAAARGRADAGGGGKPMGLLGLFGLRAALEEHTGTNDLGALAALSALQIAGQLIDNVELSIQVPLRVGKHTLPVGDKRLQIDVPPGTVLHLSTTVLPGKAGLAVASADLRFTKSVALLNAASLVPGGAGVVGGVADSLISIQLDGVGVAKDGSVTPRGKLLRPSLNPFKLFSGEKSAQSLESLVSLTRKPRLHTGLEKLAAGDIFAVPPPFGAPQLTSSFDVSALMKSVGAVVENGTYSLTVKGRAGFVDVSTGRLKVVGSDQKLQATVTGGFALAGDALTVDAKAQAVLPVAARIVFSDKGAPGATVGPLHVAAVDGAMEVSVGGQLLAAVRSLADRFQIAIPEHVDVKFDGTSLSQGSATLRPIAGGVLVEDASVRVVIDAARSTAKASLFDVTLGKGSTLEMKASGIGTDGKDLVISNASGGFSLTAEGAGKHGRLKVVHEANASGELAIRFGDEGPMGEGGARFVLSGRPGTAGAPPSGETSLDGAATVRVTPHAVVFRAGEQVKVSLEQSGAPNAGGARSK